MKSDGKTTGGKTDAVNELIDISSVTALVRTTLLYHCPTGVFKTTVRTKEDVIALGAKQKTLLKENDLDR